METVVNANKPPRKDGGGKKTDHASTATHKALITRNLRLVYGEVAGEPIPDRLTELLEKLSVSKDGKS